VLARDGMARVFEFDGSEEGRKAAVRQYQADLDVIIGTLPQRAEPNRTEAIQNLKRLGVPNPFNQRTVNP